MMDPIYKIDACPLCSEGSVVLGEHYRITVLTSQLIRLEYSEDGRFEDRPTQSVWNRNFPVPKFQVFDKGGNLEIITEFIHMIYNKEKFSPNGLSLQVSGKGCTTHNIWHFGEEATDLLGTARTLDEADGAIPLDHGLISRNGYAVMDDSRSLLLTEENWVEPRKSEVMDYYFFGYGHEYEKCLKDFYHLCGRTPLLPRFVFGNWWSRYHKYTEEEYKELILRFERENIPFSVAVVDMDWHLVDVDPKYGSGWTGYTWNKDFFPDPGEFMEWLHAHHLKITLNVHPADGVRAFEEPYPAMAKELGVDWEKEETINFDVTSQEFLNAYFKYLHHPNEEKGVDFWWLDWQQGTNTAIEGLDPLWMLNHYHYLDSRRQGKRALTFSRYAGLGSHRYPVGFSGDTVISWESLDFQPYFTANASNAGYGWWSHDIGGHMFGYRDDELSARWVQYGVFSPILRLHSTANLFSGKEPWKYNKIAESIMKKYLKLRHELIPYLYTMNRHASREGQPLVRPMYYLEPEQKEAYEVPNEYYFGTELIACPITKPVDKKAAAASFTAWLPKGIWYDIFNGRIYEGGRKLSLYRGMEDIPVFARAGAIIPLADLEEYTNSTANPEKLKVAIYAGADGIFHLYEDDGDSPEDLDENWADTEMTFTWNEKKVFTIGAAKGNTAVLPRERSYTLEFTGITNGGASVLTGGRQIEVNVNYDEIRHTLTVRIPKIAVTEEITVILEGKVELAQNDVLKETFAYLEKTQLEYNLKEEIYFIVRDAANALHAVSALQALGLDEMVFGALCEILTAKQSISNQ